MNPDVISVISIQNVICDAEKEENAKIDGKLGLKDMVQALCISLFGIIGISVIFTVPLTSIPRTDSIIYQSHWMEINLPCASNALMVVGARYLQLTTWLIEDEFMSIWIYLKMYSMDVILWNLLYILFYMMWSIYFNFNHPLPQLCFMIVIPTWVLFMIGLWFVLPSRIVEKNDFRKRMKFYMLYQLWQFMTVILREILTYLFANAPGGF